VVVGVAVAAASSAKPAAAASTDSIRIVAATGQSQYRIGDRIDYVITVDWKAPVQLLTIEPNAQLGGFEIVQSPEPQQKKLRSGWRREIAHYDLSTFDTGSLAIPSFHVVYRDAAGREQRVPTPPVTVAIKSVLAQQPDAQKLREAKPVVEPPKQLTPWQWFLVGGAALLALVGAWIFLVRVWRKRRRTLRPAAPPRRIEEVAREALARVARGDLLARGMIKEYFDEVSDIIRLYLGQRYGFAGMVTTTSELLQALRSPLSDNGRYGLVEEFSNEADLAKFARWRPDRSVCDHFLQAAYRVIDETTPAARAEPVA
jgi:hypothetical protein